MTLSRTGTLKRHSPMPRGEGLKRTGGLKRGKPLRATRWGIAPRKTPKRKLSRYERAWMAFCRSLPCMNCRCRGPSDPAHMTLGANEKGTALKVDHTQCVPLCRSCHHYFDGQANGPANPFRGWTKEERYTLAAEWVAEMRLAATPEDLNSARELERWGLGSVTEDSYSWWWLPGNALEVAA